jgi:hypothetical protein
MRPKVSFLDIFLHLCLQYSVFLPFLLQNAGHAGMAPKFSYTNKKIFFIVSHPGKKSLMKLQVHIRNEHTKPFFQIRIVNISILLFLIFES